MSAISDAPRDQPMTLRINPRTAMAIKAHIASEKPTAAKRPITRLDRLAREGCG